MIGTHQTVLFLFQHLLQASVDLTASLRGSSPTRIVSKMPSKRIPWWRERLLAIPCIIVFLRNSWYVIVWDGCLQPPRRAREAGRVCICVGVGDSWHRLGCEYFSSTFWLLRFSGEVWSPLNRLVCHVGIIHEKCQCLPSCPELDLSSVPSLVHDGSASWTRVCQ